MKRVWIIALALAAFGAVWVVKARRQTKQIYSNSYFGVAPPEFRVAPGAAWINAQPPSLAALKGRVVWIEFSFIH